MKQRRALFAGLLVAAIITVMGAGALIAQSGVDTTHHTATVAAFESLARAETELDRDVLEVIAGVIPNYDPLVEHSRRIHDLLTEIVVLMPDPDHANPWVPYQALIDAKLAGADKITRISAFATNEENYLPLAVEEFRAHSPRQVAALLQAALILVMEIKISDDLEAKLDAVLAPVAGLTSAADQAEASGIVTHLRVLAQQRRLLRGAVDAYFAVPSGAAMVGARNGYMQFYAERQARVQWVVRALLAVSVALFATLGWLFAALARADRQAKLARDRMRKLNTAVEQSPITIVITDQSGAIEYTNPGFTRHSGYAQDEVLGRNPRILKSDRTPPEVHEELWRTISAGNTWQGELTNRKKDGSFYIERAVISPVFDEAGAITHYIAMKEDITRLRQNEEMLTDANVDIERLLFAALHDLQEPVRMVAIQSQLFEQRMGAAMPDGARDNLALILAGTAQMRLLVSGLARFARSSRSAQPFVPVKLDAVIAKVIADLRPTLTDVTPEFHIGPLPQVQGDAVLLSVLFENIVGNGLKFRRADQPPVIRVTATERGGSWQIDVTDNGIGIPAESLPTLIRPFSRLHSRSTYPGSGLGLTTAERIAKLHGGSLRLSSAPGRGTTVHVRLPAIAER